MKGRTTRRAAHLNGIQLSYIEHGPVHRKGAHAWGGASHIIRLAVVRQGQVTLRHRHESETIEARDIALILGSGPVEYQSPGAKVVFADIGADDRAVEGVPRVAPFAVERGGEAAAGSALGATMMDILARDISALAPLTRADLGDALRALITPIVVAMAASASADWSHGHLRAQVLAMINEHSSDPNLTSQMLAERLGISRRSLQRLFEDQPHTVAELITARRVQQAVALLKDPDALDLTVDQISGLVGFRKGISMRRAVLNATGRLPSELRVHAVDAERRALLARRSPSP